MAHVRWSLACEEAREKLRAIAGHFDQRLVHQVQDEVLAADIEDEPTLGEQPPDTAGRRVLLVEDDQDPLGHRNVHVARLLAAR